MPSTIMTAALVGLECEPIEVQCDAGTGQFYFCIVGLPDAAVQESRERVRAAIKNSGCHFPRGRVTVNLAPADIKKEGPAYDLPIAMSILLAGGTIVAPDILKTLASSLIIGELSLEGQCRAVQGILSVVMMAKKRGVIHVYVPKDNAREAALIEGVTVYPVESLHTLIQHVNGHIPIEPYSKSDIQEDERQAVYEIDISNVKGQEHAKRVLEIAAAGGHNLLLNGPPGSGKTLLARMMPSLLPRLSFEESLEVTRMYSVAGLLSPQIPLMRVRPFRSPHHTSSAVALVGGGSWPRPGEISLAHRGVLFMDEFPEFPRNVLEALRQPLEDGVVTISRSNGRVTFPARCMLVAAQNPCPCGNYGSKVKDCICSLGSVMKYHKKISGPLLDRIDLFVDVPHIDGEKLMAPTQEHADISRVYRERIEKARTRQRERFQGEGITTNAEMSSSRVERCCQLDTSAEQLLKMALEKLALSARSYFRVLKIARTIADLAEYDDITYEHVAESLQYRPRPITEYN